MYVTFSAITYIDTAYSKTSNLCMARKIQCIVLRSPVAQSVSARYLYDSVREMPGL